MHPVAQKDAQRNVGDVHVAVGVGVRARRRGQRADVHALGDPFGDDCDAVVVASRAALDYRADDSVDDQREIELLAAKFLRESPPA